jgi:hypothetical protein
MDYLLEPQDLKLQLDSLLDEELSDEAAEWPCNQGAPEPVEEALKFAE